MCRIYAFLIIVFSSCNPANKLFVKLHPYYFNNNYFDSDSNVIKLTQEIKYNRPFSVDEEYSYKLRIDLYNCPINEKIKLSDSSCARASYDNRNVWHWENGKSEIKGWIKIKSIKNDKIIVVEKIKIMDFRRKKEIDFCGRRKLITREEFILRRRKKK